MFWLQVGCLSDEATCALQYSSTAYRFIKSYTVRVLQKQAKMTLTIARKVEKEVDISLELSSKSDWTDEKRRQKGTIQSLKDVGSAQKRYMN
eukprot:IDg13313t1